MTEIVFTVDATNDTRSVSGTMEDGVLRTGARSRPNFRIEPDGAVTLLSAKTDVTIFDFGQLVEVND